MERRRATNKFERSANDFFSHVDNMGQFVHTFTNPQGNISRPQAQAYQGSPKIGVYSHQMLHLRLEPGITTWCSDPLWGRASDI